MIIEARYSIIVTAQNALPSDKERKGIRLHAAATAAAMPASLEPMLPTQVSKPFSDPGWLFEPKWDG